MKQTSNKDMLNAIRNQASAEYQEKIPAVTGDMDARAILTTLDAYPTAKNEFIKTLTDKVVKTEFFSRVYSNPLKMLKKGMLPYGSSIEELFVQHAEAKGFFKKYSGTPQGSSAAGPTTYEKVGNFEAAELLGKKHPNMKALYISKNFAYVFDVSISDAQLKSAFLNPNGLSDLVNQLVGSLTSGAELREYKDMISLLIAAASGVQLDTHDDGRLNNGKDAIEAQTTGYLDAQKGFKPMKTVIVKESVGAGHAEPSYSHNLAIQLRTYAQKLKFMSNQYNMAGVQTFSNIDDLVFLTTPERMAEMDVEVLASAFNISHAEAQLRTIIVDELPRQFAQTLGSGAKPTKYVKPSTGSTGVSNQDAEARKCDCLGILIDKNFLQVIDTVNESRQFDNGRALMTNLFLHKQGIMANCYFANAIAFIGNKDLA